MITLEQAIEYSGFPNVDIVKMDIEGAEYSVLEATSPAVFNQIAAWVVECHPRSQKDGSAAARIFRSAGYQVAIETKQSGLELVVATKMSRRE